MDYLFSSPHWKVVEYFGYRYIWDIPKADTDNVTVVQDTESTNFDLVVELPEIDMLTWNRSNVSSNVVKSDVQSILYNMSCAEDDEFDMLGEEDENLEEYVE